VKRLEVPGRGGSDARGGRVGKKKGCGADRGMMIQPRKKKGQKRGLFVGVGRAALATLAFLAFFFSCVLKGEVGLQGTTKVSLVVEDP
jgi:hypothetical protein